MSPGLYYQMVGRGFRLHSQQGELPGAGLRRQRAAARPGRRDSRSRRRTAATGKAPAKECPECQAVIAAGFAKCPQCGYEFPPPGAASSTRPRPARPASCRARSRPRSIRVRGRAVQRPHQARRERGRSQDAPRRLPGGLARVQVRMGLLRASKVTPGRRRSPGGGAARPTRCRTRRSARRWRSSKGAGSLPRWASRFGAVAGDPYERIIDHELGARCLTPLPAGEFRQTTTPTRFPSERCSNTALDYLQWWPLRAARDPRREAACAGGLEAVPASPADGTAGADVVRRRAGRCAC
jgi:DNA repair protein RadD